MPDSTAKLRTQTTPERQASQSSIGDSLDVVVLESSPTRPGSSQVSRSTKQQQPSTSASRLSSFYFRGTATPADSSTVFSSPAAQSMSSASSASSLVQVGSAGASQVDLTKMAISQPQEDEVQQDKPRDFSQIVGQFKWSGASVDGDDATPRSRKRSLVDVRQETSRKRPTPVAVLSDSSSSDGESVSRGPRRGRLQRGARPSSAIIVSDSRSPSPAPAAITSARRTLARRGAAAAQVIGDSDEDSGDDAGAGGFERAYASIDPHVMRLFNTGTAAELMEKTGASVAEAQIVLGLRPFRDVDAVEQSLRRTKGVRLAMFNQFRDKLLGHAEVEDVIAQCAGAMRAAGVQSNEKTGAIGFSEAVGLEQPRMIDRAFSLKHYQLEGVEWLTCLRDAGASGILADEMGLGNCFVCRGIEQQRVSGPSLVVCPSSTLENWMNECRRFAPGLRVVAYYGRRPSAYDSSYDLMVTTYNVATGNKMDRMFLKRRPFDSLILDEGHMVKNCMSSRYKWLMQIRTPFRLLLTGTPLQNNLQELVSLLTFILPQVFAESQPMLSHAFKNKASAAAPASGAGKRAESEDGDGAQTPTVAAGASGAVGPVEAQHIGQAKTLLRPFVLRRRKCDVLGDLPSKTEIIVRMDLTPTQRRLYDSIAAPAQQGGIQRLVRMEDASALLDTAGATNKPGSNSSGNSWISTFMDMRKVADHPLLLRSQYSRDQLREMAKKLMREPDYAEANLQYILEDMEYALCAKYPRHMRPYMLSDSLLLDSAKVIKLREIVDECVERGEKLLLFSQFTSMLNVLESVFKVWSIDYCRLDGQTKVDERQTMIDEFNRPGNKLPVFLLSTKAGGFGINLTSANVVVIYDAGNNPSEERQAEDRAHRVGQTKDVRVYKFIGNDTIDEVIWENASPNCLLSTCFDNLFPTISFI
ncbi:P-loop containing nucleoside triphosphate hydrolase protein [Kickxella alabastrina]|uniref:P-loop containing nucleoside triphosphate hydrolase protein n=1 Tax=Kickxella alabastrina TaxID=61397 RepID=UPI00221E5B52|nr:P-loop containing nucleoside triphosphate hydrolase protein [Kickxella alabastrina]KAI7825426.1 P-loop containing nucleoside triphosphate hydrolase protein [Kickxella alabastrina]